VLAWPTATSDRPELAQSRIQIANDTGKQYDDQLISPSLTQLSDQL
jgi:hypothetical protein